MSQAALPLDQVNQVAPARVERRRWKAAIVAWAADLLLVNLAFVIAYWIRYPLGFPSQVAEFNYVPLIDFFPAQLTLSVIMAAVLPYVGLYRQVRGAGWISKLTAIFNATTVSIGLLIVLTYLSRLYAESRLLYITAWGLIIVLLAGSKALQDALRSWLYRRGVGVDNLIVIGGGDVGKMVMQHVAAQPGLGYRLLGFVDDF
ncbi:MAG: hypothetical protein KGJ86_04430, partial [Chloroflexota bacterium]|nr:hypothetical protein [Chloroflexota bacterium]